MRDVRNIDNRLIFKYEEETGELETKSKDCITVVMFPPGTKIEKIINTKKTS